ncbi:MAG TPA: CpsD/CapB family tyrosine-protein kinase [Oligoflexia bacterium]|nr:CpsD/CapB family tyrosine-protein kinase [Oligoflexia bacterium]HMP47488.1 CpsD/CapB family tyrosine-protein kinase [Oligoflexia bacterium]
MKFIGKKKVTESGNISVLQGGVAGDKGAFKESVKAVSGTDLMYGDSVRPVAGLEGLGKSLSNNSRNISRNLSEGGVLIAGGSIQDLEAAERFRMLRAHLERQNLTQDKTDLLAITSAVPSEGKSMVSVNLSRAFSTDPNGRTILVDCDLRKPNVHRFYGESSTPGLSDLLVAGKTLESVIRQVEPGLDIICAGSPVVDSTRTIESPGLSLLLAELKKRYRHIIIDCPPVLMCSEVLSLAQLASGTILVARAWRTEKQLVSEASDMLKNHGLLGVVLNECSDSLRHYGYYGYYGYVGAGRAAGKGEKSSKSLFSRLFFR